MNGIARAIHDAYEKSEDRLGRSWPLWVMALLFYTAAAYALLTKVRLPSPLHLVVYTMAVAIVGMTLTNVEWGLLGLVMMIPFARPGFTIGDLEIFHVSAFNLAVLGVWVVYLMRFSADREVSAKGPLVRRTPVDVVNAVFIILVIATTLANLNFNVSGPARAMMLVYLKEHILYLMWFYLVVTLLRTPDDVRRFSLFFAMSGFLVALVGLQARVSGAMEQARVITEAEEMGGVAGGRTGGVGESGWFGLAHPNMYAAFLIMSLPFWFYATEHFRRFASRVFANLATLAGFVALLYTYSRSAWGGIMMSMGALGLRDPRSLRRAVAFVVLFAVVAQLMTLALVGMGVIEVIQMRFEQLGRSRWSARPEIFAAALDLIRERPFTGVGMGTFMWHASVTFTSRIHHAHNLLLTYAAELGLPAAAVYTVFLAWMFVLAIQNLRSSRAPGYGFISQAGFVGLFAVVTLCQFDFLFFDRNVGHAFYALLAIIVSYNRLMREGAIAVAPEELGSVGKHLMSTWRAS